MKPPQASFPREMMSLKKTKKYLMQIGGRNCWNFVLGAKAIISPALSNAGFLAVLVWSWTSLQNGGMFSSVSL